MNAEHDGRKDEEGLEAERQVTSMRDRLSKEAASWSKERREHSGETGIAPTQTAQRPSTRPAGEARKSSTAALAGKAPGERSKPFSMSYDGMTQAEYIRYLRDHGLR